MTIDEECAAFLTHIRISPEDDVLRSAFSDWLDEHDQPEEADRQRQWRKAKEWLTWLAGEFGGTGSEMEEEEQHYGPYRPITYEDVIKTGHDYIDSGDYFTQQGSERARNMMGDKDIRCLFWRHWETMTGRNLDELDPKERKWFVDYDGQPNPFSCSC